VTTPPELLALRHEIDTCDEQLVAVLAQRARAVEGVMRFKRTHHVRVVDRAREDAMLIRIGEVAQANSLDPRVARQVLRTVIDAFTLLEVEELGPDD
jgi:chorismate mutase